MAIRQIKVLKYATIIWHRLWLLLVVSSLSGAAAFAYAYFQVPLFESSTRLLIEEASSARTGSREYTDILASERRAQTYTQLLTSDALLRKVYASVLANGSEPSESQLRNFKSSIDVQAIRNTQLIRITVRDSNAEKSAELANSLVAAFILQTRQLKMGTFAPEKLSLQGRIDAVSRRIAKAELSLDDKGLAPQERETAKISLAEDRQTYSSLVRELEAVRIAEAQSNSSIIQLENATAASAPVWPKISQIAIAGALLGLLLAVAIVAFIETVDNTVKDPDALVLQTGLPVMSFIGHIEKLAKRDRSGKSGGPIAVEEPRSAVAEAFRILRTNIEFSSAARAVKTLLVSSAISGDGKSTTAANLATVVAQGDKDVLVIDCDLRRPTQHHLLLGVNTIGLSDLFVQRDLELDVAVQKNRVGRVSLLSAGKIPPNPAELLDTDRMSVILEHAKRKYDLVIIDAPPALPVTDAMVLAKKVDAVLLVVRAGHTRTSAITQVTEQFKRANINVIGLVVNDIVQERLRGYSYRHSRYFSTVNKPNESVTKVSPAR